MKVVFGGASVHMLGVWGSLRMEGEGGGALFRGEAFVKCSVRYNKPKLHEGSFSFFWPMNSFWVKISLKIFSRHSIYNQ